MANLTLDSLKILVEQRSRMGGVGSAAQAQAQAQAMAYANKAPPQPRLQVLSDVPATTLYPLYAFIAMAVKDHGQLVTMTMRDTFARINQLAMRLNSMSVEQVVACKWSIASVHEAGEIVYLTLAPKDGEPITISDEAKMFPSDGLMAQLHLLLTP